MFLTCSCMYVRFKTAISWCSTSCSMTSMRIVRLRLKQPQAQAQAQAQSLLLSQSLSLSRQRGEVGVLVLLLLLKCVSCPSSAQVPYFPAMTGASIFSQRAASARLMSSVFIGRDVLSPSCRQCRRALCRLCIQVRKCNRGMHKIYRRMHLLQRTARYCTGWQLMRGQS